MSQIAIDSREESERELLSIIYNKPSAMELLQIKPKFLKSDSAKKLLEYAIENYSKNKIIIPSEIIDLLDEGNIKYFAEIFSDTFYYESSWLQQFEVLQKNLIRFYKEDIIGQLNIQLASKKIDYDTFIKKIKELDNIQLQKDIKELTRSEIINNINENQARIKLNKFPKINNVLKLVQGDFLVIGGITGSGKSGLMLNLMSDLMKEYQCIYFNMEMSKSTIYKRIVAILSELRVDDVDNPRTAYQEELIENTFQHIETSKIIIEHKASNLQNVKSTIIKTKDKKRHTIIFLDHIGLVKVDNAKTIYEQMTEVAKELRQICLEYDCTVIATSQLNRTAYNSDTLTLNMLKDTGETENSSSKIILLYKDADEPADVLDQRMIIDVAKNRDGYTGLINVIYHKDKQIFEEIKEKYR